MLKRLTLLVCLSAVLTACGNNVSPESATVEDLIPKGTDFIVMLDASEEDQRENFDQILSGFEGHITDQPGGEALWKEFEEEFEYSLEWDFGENAPAIFAGEWKFALAATVYKEDEKLPKTDEPDVEDQIQTLGLSYEEGERPFWMVFETDQPELVVEAINFESREESTTTLNGEEFKTWEIAGDLFAMQVGNIFVFTPTDKNYQEIADLATGESKGFSENDDIELLEENSGIVKFYLSPNALNFVDKLYSEMNFDIPLAEMIQSALVYNITLEENGIRATTNYEIDTKIFEELSGFSADQSLSLVDKVNGENLTLYLEGPGTGTGINTFIDQIGGLSSFDNDIKQFAAFMNMFKDDILGGIGIEYDDLVKTLDQNMAIAAGHNEGNTIPHFSFYLDVENETAHETAEKLLEQLDQWMELAVELINEEVQYGLPDFEGEFFEIQDADSGIKTFQMSEAGKDFILETIRLEAENDIYIQELLATIDFDQMMSSIVFNYGIIDDVFVLSIGNPDLTESFGKNPVSENESYQALLDQVNPEAKQMVFFFDGSALSDYLGSIVTTYEPELGSGEIEEINAVREYLEMFSAIGVSGVDGDMAVSDFLLEIKN